jgi:hypothetical protein
MRTERSRYLSKGCPFNQISTATNLIDSRASVGSTFQWYYMRYRKLGRKTFAYAGVDQNARWDHDADEREVAGDCGLTAAGGLETDRGRHAQRPRGA